MSSRYNLVAGQSVERIAALSDGVFAVAMTLLVLDLHAPAAQAIHSEQGLWQALAALKPGLLTYLMSFLTLGIFWVGQQTQINQFARADRNLAWIHIAFLFIVTLLPFSTSLLAAFIAYRTALLLYWANIFLFGAVLFASWRYARHAGLVKPDAPDDIDRSIERRVVIAQTFYVFGAALCVFDTYWSIGCIVLVQLYYAIAPHAGWFRRAK
jgi:uncharacterized membrane protein